MGHLYFIRHGQTIWNIEGKIAGATDVPLTELGHEQAEEAGRLLLKEGIRGDRILYSPLRRAEDTARHISRITGIPCFPEPRLKEQNFGKWEGKPVRGEAFIRDKQCFASRYDGGESMLQVGQRVYNLLDELKGLSEKETVILVAHNGISRVIKSYFEDMSNEEFATFAVKNCSITRFDF